MSFKIRGVPDTPNVLAPDVTVVEEDFSQPEPEQIQKKPRRSKKDREAEKIAKLDPIDRILYALKNVKESPDRNTLEEWKNIHGKFFMSSVDGDGIFLWKTIKRTEYKNLLNSGAMDKPGSMPEFVVRRALLWPRATQEFLQTSDAGVVETLFKQIWHQSGFISEDQALMMIEKI